jgi:hypothetical protein
MEISRLKSEGFVVLNIVTKRGADNKIVAHPKSTNGCADKLCQEIKYLFFIFSILIINDLLNKFLNSCRV